jgi:citrate lyase beta subunit
VSANTIPRASTCKAILSPGRTVIIWYSRIPPWRIHGSIDKTITNVTSAEITVKNSLKVGFLGKAKINPTAIKDIRMAYSGFTEVTTSKIYPSFFLPK